MELGLENKVVVVTGGGKGIGFACWRGVSENTGAIVPMNGGSNPVL